MRTLLRASGAFPQPPGQSCRAVEASAFRSQGFGFCRHPALARYPYRPKSPKGSMKDQRYVVLAALLHQGTLYYSITSSSLARGLSRHPYPRDYALKWDDETQMSVNAHAALLSQFAKADARGRGAPGERDLGENKWSDPVRVSPYWNLTTVSNDNGRIAEGQIGEPCHPHGAGHIRRGHCIGGDLIHLPRHDVKKHGIGKRHARN